MKALTGRITMRLETLEKLLRVPFSLIAMETTQRANVLDTFRLHSALNSQAIYIWSARTGLYRQDVSHIKIPNTRSPEQLLNYIKNEKNQVVFVLLDFEKEVENPFIENSMHDFAKDRKRPAKIFILSKTITLSEKFRNLAVETKKLFKMKLQRAA